MMSLFASWRSKLGALLLVLTPGVSWSADAPWSPAWQDNVRWSFDFSSRPLYYPIDDRSASIHAAGIDLHKVFSGATTDIGTLTAQVYLTRIDNFQGHPGFFDDEDDTEVVFRIFNFNYKGLGPRLPNIKIGHLEIAYGLEQPLDSNGTLQQYATPQNLGIKADWGISLNKEHRHFEYEVSATTGGGQKLQRQDGSYVYAARIGTPGERNVALGASVYRSYLGGLRRTRAGTDLRYQFGRSNLNGEVSIGSNGDADVLNSLVEYNRVSRTEAVATYLQLVYLSQDGSQGWDRTINANLGIRYRPDTHFDLSAQYTHTLRNPQRTHPSTIALQMRYRL